ncbi:hypothetical protein DV515_00015074, partial [Chloebia gouldiae]
MASSEFAGLKADCKFLVHLEVSRGKEVPFCSVEGLLWVNHAKGQMMEPSGTEQLSDDPDPGGKSQDQETKKQHESEQKLSKITHNALENINVIGQGLKHLFQHQRRRSSVSPHDVQQAQAELEPDLDLESQSVCVEIDGVSTHPTALNRVLQQIRVPPKMKRGTSLHSRWGKGDAPKGSPQINRRSAQDIQSGRPRSSSTTDAPTNLSVMEIASSIY